LSNIWNANKAVQYPQSQARPNSTGKCAEFTRHAIDAGGVILSKTNYAKDYGQFLKSAGFLEISQNTPLKPGDVAIIQPIKGHPYGHMCMFDGRIWISDFRQYRGFYPGLDYRNEKPPYKFYRHP